MTDPTTPLAAALAKPDALSVALQRAGVRSPTHMTYADIARCVVAALTDGRDDLGTPDIHASHAFSDAAPVDAGPATEPEGLRAAARRWWEAHRPVEWTAEQHHANPLVNVASEAEKALAWAIARDIETGALTASEPGLDAAWREAEAAITRRGTGGTLLLFQTLDRPSNPRPEGERYCAKVTMSGMPEGFFYGPTPAAALRALAARLCSTGPDR